MVSVIYSRSKKIEVKLVRVCFRVFSACKKKFFAWNVCDAGE